MSNRVVVQEGYALPFSDLDGYRRRRKHRKTRKSRRGGSRRGGASQRRKFASAAKSCGGHGYTRRQFQDCMKRKLKK